MCKVQQAAEDSYQGWNSLKVGMLLVPRLVQLTYVDTSSNFVIEHSIKHVEICLFK